MWICGEDGRIKGKFPRMADSLSTGNAYDSITRDRELNAMPTSGNLFSRKFLESVMPIPIDDYKISADTYLLFSNLKNID